MHQCKYHPRYISLDSCTPSLHCTQRSVKLYAKLEQLWETADKIVSVITILGTEEAFAGLQQWFFLSEVEAHLQVTVHGLEFYFGQRY